MIDATVARRGVISDEELLIICLKNAPVGTDKKQVMRLIKHYEEESPRFLEGLAKLTQRKSPWEDNECKPSTS